MGEVASTMKRILDTKSEFKDGKLDVLSPLAQPPKCPECASEKIWKDGLRKTSSGDVQRYLCRICGYRFSQTEPKNHSEPLKKPSNWSINNASTINLDRQVCEILTEDSKNLAKVQSRTEKQAAGATKLSEAQIKGKIVNFGWQLKKNNYSEETIKQYMWILKLLVRLSSDILNPESIKEAIAQQREWSQARRKTVAAAYTKFLETHGMTWKPPKWNVTRKLPFIPTEKEIDQLISASGKKTSSFLQLLKETAMRAGEANRLKWSNVDFERKTITLNDPEKNSQPRIFKVSSELIAMLKALPKINMKVFSNSLAARKSSFLHARKNATRKLQNPRLLQISFHTFRHWKATMLYHQTKDVLFVKEFLGHRKIDSTLLYIQLEKTLFKETTDEFTVKVAGNPEEIKALLEVGFEYVCEKDGLMFFRKRR